MSHSIFLYDEDVSQVVQKHAKIIFNYPKEKIWNQSGVSLQKRIDVRSDFKGRVDRTLTPKNLDRYIVPADGAAPTRCIDGRITVGWNENLALPLGPKVAGGTVHAALAHRIVDTEYLHVNLRFEEDIKYVVRRFKQIGIGVGGHIDNHQKGSNTGCGAVDNINLILDRLQSPEHQEQLRGLAHLILGEAYNSRGVLNEVIGRMLYLDALKPSYMPKEKNNPNGEFLYKNTVMSTLRSEADRQREVIPALHGAHNEVAVVLNFTAHTTFDTDRFSHDNDNDIQVFAWDIWHMYEEAQRLYSYSMLDSIESQHQAVNNRIKYVVTRTLLGIATTMVLTDGSLRLIAVTPGD
ncbi:MAG TPA: cadmium-containing carbonic anhydrase [Candidatus Saccharimonadales bacterium]|nr:cadmium-containing carbonic anhydrase [Candidatus Saccharimonadales bacterium]